jgi:hypothetical protein
VGHLDAAGAQQHLQRHRQLREVADQPAPERVRLAGALHDPQAHAQLHVLELLEGAQAQRLGLDLDAREMDVPPEQAMPELDVQDLDREQDGRSPQIRRRHDERNHVRIAQGGGQDRRQRQQRRQAGIRHHDENVDVRDAGRVPPFDEPAIEGDPEEVRACRLSELLDETFESPVDFGVVSHRRPPCRGSWMLAR